MQFQYYETFLTLAKKSGCNLCSRLFFFTNDCNSQAKMLPYFSKEKRMQFVQQAVFLYE